MKVPATPPEVGFGTLEEIRAILNTVQGPSVGGKYLHWDDLRHRTPPDGLTHEQWWTGLKFQRLALARTLPLVDRKAAPFRYALVDPSHERLHEIDSQCGGLIRTPEPITNPETRDQYYIGSLIEEAITSSQLEGATTTRQVAKQMLRAGRKPADRSERMILNNYQTMRRIGEVKNERLTADLVFEIHRRVTEQTLDDPSAAGRFRTVDEPVVVSDEYGTVFHDPPDATELPERMERMCAFANGEIPKEFLPPAIRAILLHFWLAHDHPFIDGNGRTARALFYWSMLNQGYWLFEFISISQIILSGPTKYGRAFLHSETDDNDLTYFILYHLEVIRRAVSSLHEYIERRTSELQEVQSQLRALTVFNHRQRGLIAHALKHPHQIYTVAYHRNTHDVAYDTARNDLLDLSDRGLLQKSKVKKQHRFEPVPDLAGRLRQMSK